ncbi:MAG TPA: DUF2235 domain-containing protein [Rubrivivax sp.]|nr:DUF2235 domain-containing protein [Rubrivivax sp.]
MRQLVLLCDGTNNNLTGGAADTHVVLLAELLRRHPDAQRLLFYDPGVGNPGQAPGTTWWDKMRRQWERIEGLAFGRGVYDNIAEGYLFLMRHWRAGAAPADDDRIFLFGFSRGAFTARSIAGMVNMFGILQPQQEPMVPTLLHLYFADETESVARMRAQVLRLFAQTAQRPLIHFVGVWDTVASVGLPPFGLRFRVKPTLAGKRFVHVRQALALDEQRAQFLPRVYDQENGRYPLADGRGEGDVLQLWFRGAHGDVGGGYAPAQAALARTPLHWMVSEAVRCGLALQAGGVALDREAAVAEALDALALPSVQSAERAPRCIHSELCARPWWALSGMTAREPGAVLRDGLRGASVRAQAHPSVAAWPARFPQDSCWSRPRSPLALAAALAALLLLWLLHEWLVRPSSAVPLPGLPAIGALCAALPLGADNCRFQLWQWSAVVNPQWREGWRAFESPHWALCWDFGLIVAYAYLLARWTSRAFAALARLRGVDSPPMPWLGRLAWALPLAVAADAAENLLTWAGLLPGALLWQWTAWPLHLLLSAAVTLKWAALLLALGLVGAGLARRRVR